MSIVLLPNIVLAAVAAMTLIGLLSWSMVTQRRDQGMRMEAVPRSGAAAAVAARAKRPLLAVVVVGGLAIWASPAAAAGTCQAP